MKTLAEQTERPHRRLSCRRVQTVLVDYLEGQLPADEHVRVSAHLQRCRRCAAERAALKKTLNLLGRRELPEPDEHFWMEMKQRVRERLREDQAPGRQPSPVPVRSWAPALAVAATVVFLFLWWTHHPGPPAPGPDQMISQVELQGRQSLMALGQSSDLADIVSPPGSPGDSLIFLLAAVSRPSETLSEALIETKIKQRPDLWEPVIEEEIDSERPVDALLEELSETQLRKLSARLSRLAG